MHILSEAQYQLEADSFFQKVFASDDAFGELFSPNITERIILYPCESYFESPLINGLIAAATSLGDTACYLTQLWQGGFPHHLYIPLSELHEAYGGTLISTASDTVQFDMNGLLDYFLYSAKGNWGFAETHERHGVLGGSPKFIDQVREYIPNLDEQVYPFLNKYQGLKDMSSSHLTVEWLPRLLTHVYGQETAHKLLCET